MISFSKNNLKVNDNVGFSILFVLLVWFDCPGVDENIPPYSRVIFVNLDQKKIQFVGYFFLLCMITIYDTQQNRYVQELSAFGRRRECFNLQNRERQYQQEQHNFSW
eukprot:TRINITY_DN3346_c0_g2_i1.p3 TRINITY_DN3346_c0_g2~~TRINITY_DN3346_c0_g2_i1.p3  ORF type:complete len:107 (-),score=2.87 TRINITY_DN3346_c0_g2_i1:193-513(-)